MSTSDRTAYLIFDTESIPDGKLLAKVKYPDEEITPEQAIAKAQAEARAKSPDGSDFLPVTFQYPIAVCAVRVGDDYSLQAVVCLDAPQFRTREIVAKFWQGLEHYSAAQLVTFNGRGFDLPLMELAAFRYGLGNRSHFLRNRKRFDNTYHFDLMDWITNYGAFRMTGGLNLLSKLLGKPGKMDVAGD